MRLLSGVGSMLYHFDIVLLPRKETNRIFSWS
jgi:hypothetical protein